MCNPMVQSSSSESSKYLLVHGTIYDITLFVKKHPGGSIILHKEWNVNEPVDATDDFIAFHSRSEKASKYLKSLPKAPASIQAQISSVQDQEMLKDFRNLNQQLKEQGFYDPSVSHVAYRLFELLGLLCFGLYLSLATPFPLTGLLLLGLFEGRCGWFMHEAGHYSLTGSIAIDRLIQEISYNIGCGMSAAYWRNQHNKHHASPQKEEYDVDLNTLPLVAFNKKLLKGKDPGFYIRLQHILFAPLSTLLVTLGWQFYLHPRFIMRRRLGREALFLFLRYAFHYYIFSTFSISFANAFQSFLFINWIAGMYIFTNFAVSHTHLPLVDSTSSLNWVRYSAHETMNCNNHFLTNWWMSYLNFQIEHHLFPALPQFRHPRVQPHVQALFKKHGLHYNSKGYWKALEITFSNLYHVAQ